MRVNWLPSVLREAGLDVYEMPGCMELGKELGSVMGVVGHHTASGPNWQDGHVALLLKRGRSDLAGPLAQLGLERDGTLVVVSTGRCNHNGYGEWGNNSIGIEAYNDGKGEPWAQAQLDAYVRAAAAILGFLHLDSSKFKGHRETDPTRKPDPVGIDLDDFRRQIDKIQNGAPAPPHQSQEDDMGIYIYDTENKVHFHVYGERFRVMTDTQFLKRQGLARLGGITITPARMHPWAIAAFFLDFQLIEDIPKLP